MPLKSKFQDIEIPESSIFELLFSDLSEEDAARNAIVDSGSHITFGELKEKIEFFAGALAARGVKPGDVIALHCPNSTTFAVAFHGILRAGATVTTVATLSTADDIANQLKASGASKLLTTSSIGWGGAVGAGRAGLAEDAVIGLTGIEGIATLIAEGHAAPDVEIDPNSVAVIPFSSGTTGKPKGVQLTHRNLVSNILQTAAGLGSNMDRDTRVITILPYFHIYGMNTQLNHCLYQRATQYTFGKFGLPEFLSVIQDAKINFAFIAPPIAVALAKHPVIDKFDLSSLETIISGAASLQLELASQVEQRLGCVIGQGFGMTESSPVTHIRLGINAPLNSIGQAVPNTEYKIVDVADDALPEIPTPAEGQSEAGELWVKGPQVMKGYLNNEEATAETLVDGWLRTGDMAELDAEGNVYIVDRLKELIKYKGYQVPPAELEDLLLQHPGIADAAAVGVIREHDGEEIPKAFVVTNPDTVLTEQEVMDYISDRVAPYKQIRVVEFIDEIPKSATGKILRRLLRQK